MASTFIRPVFCFAKVITSDMSEAIKISIPKYVMDPRLTMYFITKKEVYAFDNKKECCEGDYVVVREITEVPIEGKKINYSVEKLIYKLGHYIDPVSGKKVAGTEYIDDIMKTTELFGYKRPYHKYTCK